jgi:hypothetical protein
MEIIKYKNGIIIEVQLKLIFMAGKFMVTGTV